MEFIHYPAKDDSTYEKEYELGDLACVIKDIPYSNRTSAQKLDLDAPSCGDGPFPVIVYIHGGGLMRGDKSRHINPLLQGLRYGYALACVNYRLAEEAVFPAMMYDVTTAIRFLKEHADTFMLDAKRIIVWGETHGAYLACLTGIYGKTGEYNDPVCPYAGQDAGVSGVIDYWAPSDLLLTYKENFLRREADPETPVIEEIIFGCTGEDLIKSIQKYPGPLDGICSNLPPFYILHGELDTEIPLFHSRAYYERLTAAGNEAYMEIVPDTKHSLPNYTKCWQIEGT